MRKEGDKPEKTSLMIRPSIMRKVKKKAIDLDLDFSRAIEAACEAWTSDYPSGENINERIQHMETRVAELETELASLRMPRPPRPKSQE